MKHFIIHADQEFRVWQHNIFDIVADSMEEAIKQLNENPSEDCYASETLPETEYFIKTDFVDNFEIEEHETKDKNAL